MIKSFSMRMLAFAGLGMVAAGAEMWDTFQASKDPLISDMEKTLLQMKAGVLLGQGIIFGAQLFYLLGNGLGFSSIAAIFAPWMLVGLFVLNSCSE
ncbi:hypothetical protein [Aeromonas sp. WP2-W18-CRE-05]|uniref:hypothetical protein n=1 Tax=Aeromonas sp. WP2-W18-CRE-05 TaxID=2675707 RepID=UPI0016049ADE|nr:hypothetical protein [Aeromonas sp. WP2-W18-CRE-05]